MAVDLATGYIDLVPSASGIADDIAKELNLDDIATSAGKSASEKLTGSLLGGAKGTGEKLATALGLAAVGALAIKSADDVEGAQNTIIRSTGATGKAAEDLEESFRNVASGTSASFDTVATTLSQLYQRTGLQGKALESLTTQVVTFNRISKDSPINVDELTRATAGYNVEASKMGMALDDIFKISQQTGVPLASLLTDLGSSGAVLRQFGFGLDQSASFLGELNKAGVDSSQIIPGLKRVLQDAATAGKAPADQLRDLLTQLQGLIDKGDTLGARNLAQQIFGSRGTGLVDAVVNGKVSLQQLDTQLDLTGDGIVQTAGKTSTLSGSLGVLKNNAELALAGFATPAIQAANDLLKDLLPTVQDLGTDFASLPDPLKLGAAAAVGLAFGIGKIGDFATNSLPGLISLKDTIVDLVGANAAVEGGQLASALGAVGTGGLLAGGGLAAAGASAALFVTAGAGVAAISYGIVKALDLGDTSLDKFQQAGRDAARAAIDQASTTSDAYKSIAERRAQLATQLHGYDEQLRKDGIDNANAVKDNVDALVGSLPASERPAFQALRQEYDDLGVSLDNAAPKHQKQVDLQKQEESAARLAAAGLDQYTASVAAGADPASTFAKLTDDETKALNDLQSALLQAAGGPLAYQQSLLSLQKAQADLTVADQKVTDAQNAYNAAQQQFGDGSQQALLTWVALTQAQQDQAGAQLNVQQANLNVGQSTIALSDNQSQLLTSLGVLGDKRADQLTAIDAEITKLQTLQGQYPATAGSLQPYLDQLELLRQKIADVPTGPQPPTTFDIEFNFASKFSGNDAASALAALGGGQFLDPDAINNNQLAIVEQLAAAGFFHGATGGIGDFDPAGEIAVLHGPEAVLPLNDPTRSWQLIAQAGLFDAMPTPKGATFGDVHVTYAGPINDEARSTRRIMNDLRDAASLAKLG